MIFAIEELLGAPSLKPSHNRATYSRMVAHFVKISEAVNADLTKTELVYLMDKIVPLIKHLSEKANTDFKQPDTKVTRDCNPIRSSFLSTSVSDMDDSLTGADSLEAAIQLRQDF